MLDVFTAAQGRLTVLAKGGKRSKQRFFGVLLAGHLLEMNLEPTKSADLWRLASARVLASPSGPAPGLSPFAGRRGRCLELLLRATPLQAPQTGALELALATLARLEQGHDPVELGSGLAIFLVRLLDLLGYGLNLEACLHCGRPLAQMKSPRLTLGGGVVCPSCPPGHRDHPVPPGLVKFLAVARTLEAPAPGPPAPARRPAAPGLGVSGRVLAGGGGARPAQPGPGPGLLAPSRTDLPTPPNGVSESPFILTPGRGGGFIEAPCCRASFFRPMVLS